MFKPTSGQLTIPSFNELLELSQEARLASTIQGLRWQKKLGYINTSLKMTKANFEAEVGRDRERLIVRQANALTRD